MASNGIQIGFVLVPLGRGVHTTGTTAGALWGPSKNEGRRRKQKIPPIPVEERKEKEFEDSREYSIFKISRFYTFIKDR